ncbi:histidine kinase [Nocardia fusca]|uniref:sensor histidine kinase n=1 Tax=Nocardia fusca TaxID=941183 RepID=UPI00378E7BED
MNRTDIAEAAVLDMLSAGAAIIDDTGTPVWVNQAGKRLLALSGAPVAMRGLFGSDTGLRSDPDEMICEWTNPAGKKFVLACQMGGCVPAGRIVLFRDVTVQRDHQQRVAALARTAASMASDSSLEAVLEAMAAEVQASEGIAGTQIVTRAPDSDQLQLMGSAGFHHEITTFFDLLMESQSRGADLITTRAMRECRQFVLPGRRAQMLRDPAWGPLHGYVSQIEWDDFISSPLLSRRGVVGALNVYVTVGYRVNPSMLEFLQSMADQAALAVDYATLISHERANVRIDERKKLARDLHDSVVQHVFSIGMQARGLGIVAAKLPPAQAERVGRISAEISELAGNVRRDLRGIVLALQPPVSAEIGLVAALSVLVEGIMRRDAIQVSLRVDPALNVDVLDDAFVEDIYLIVSEALHNAVKHAAPSTIAVVVAVAPEDHRITILVRDDGRGPGRDIDQGYGLTSMHDRAARWAGEVSVEKNIGGPGTTVSVNLTAPMPFARNPLHQ